MGLLRFQDFGRNSETSRLAITAVVASAVTLSVVELHRLYRVQQKRRDLELRAAANTPSRDIFQQVFGTVTKAIAGDGLATSRIALPDTLVHDEDLIREQLSRNYSFFGDEAMATVRRGRVIVVGCGGVGSWAAVMLVRSGISHVRLIDFDMVTLSSLNRHAAADLSDVGTPKVAACKRFIKRVAPWVQVDCRQQLWEPGPLGEELLNGDFDWVIDAIDNISTKVELLKTCHIKGIKVFASMGAGAKCDPTRVQISDISSTYEDPLARSVRRGLRIAGITEGIPVVYSTEIPSDVKLLPLPEAEVQKGDVHELTPFDNFRVRILPVLGPLPAIFGLHIATYLICELARKPILNPLATRNRKKLYEKLLRDLTAREARLRGPTELMERLPIDETDIAYVFEDLYRGRSSIPPHTIPQRPILARWDSQLPLRVNNCVVLGPADVRLLDEAGGRGEEVEQWAEGATRSEVLKSVNLRVEEALSWLRAMNS